MSIDSHSSATSLNISSGDVFINSEIDEQPKPRVQKISKPKLLKIANKSNKVVKKATTDKKIPKIVKPNIPSSVTAKLDTPELIGELIL